MDNGQQRETKTFPQTKEKNFQKGIDNTQAIPYPIFTLPPNLESKMNIGTVIEREVRVGPTAFLVVVMRINNANSYLVLDEAGQTVDNKPFMIYIDKMIEELNKKDKKNFR